MKNQLLLFIIVSIVFSCKRRDTKTYPIPDNTAQIEANFPYKDIKKPLVFINMESSDSIQFLINTKRIESTKNIQNPLNETLNRLQSTYFNWITIEATNFRYSLSQESVNNPSRFQHDFKVFNSWATISTNPVEAGTLIAGRNSFYIHAYADTLTLFGKSYYNTFEINMDQYATNKNERNILQVLFCESNGIIAFYDSIKHSWYYLKP